MITMLARSQHSLLLASTTDKLLPHTTSLGEEQYSKLEVWFPLHTFTFVPWKSHHTTKWSHCELEILRTC